MVMIDPLGLLAGKLTVALDMRDLALAADIAHRQQVIVACMFNADLN